MLQIFDLEVEGLPVQTGKKAVVPQKYLWLFLQSSFRGRVRAACLQFVSAFLVRMPKDVVRHHIP